MREPSHGEHEFAVVETIPGSSDNVWALVGGFNSLPEFDPTSRWSILEAGGRDRRVGVVETGEIVERLITFDELNRCYSYITTELVGLEFPFNNYFSLVKVLPGDTDDSCILDWRGWADVRDGCTYGAVEAELMGIYRGIAETLKRRFGSDAASAPS